MYEEVTNRLQYRKTIVRVSIRMDSILTALGPILILSRAFGLNVFEYPVGRERPFLTVLYVFVLYLLHGGMMYHTMIITSYEITESPVFFTVLLVNEFALLASIILNLYYHKEFKRCLGRIVMADNTLERLGVPKGYLEVRKSATKMALMWCLAVLVLSMCDILYALTNFDDIGQFYIGTTTLNFALQINMITDLSLCIILRYMESRYDRLNKCIREIIKDEVWEGNYILKIFPVRRRNLFDDQRNSRIIWTTMHLHFEMRKILGELNRIFGKQILLQMCTYILVLTVLFVQAYNTFVRFEEHNLIRMSNMIFITIWISIYATKVYYINDICECISEQANETPEIVIEIINFTEDVETRKELIRLPFKFLIYLVQIMQFVFQTLQRPLTFTGLGFFQLGYEFLHELVASIMTILVIIIQTVPIGTEVP